MDTLTYLFQNLNAQLILEMLSLFSTDYDINQQSFFHAPHL